jgi:hypothetical protein
MHSAMTESAVVAPAVAAFVTAAARSAGTSTVIRTWVCLLTARLQSVCDTGEVAFLSWTDKAGGAPMRAISGDVQLQCVGCDKNYLWYFAGIRLVSLVRVGLHRPCLYLLKLKEKRANQACYLRRRVGLARANMRAKTGRRHDPVAKIEEGKDAAGRPKCRRCCRTGSISTPVPSPPDGSPSWSSKATGIVFNDASRDAAIETVVRAWRTSVRRCAKSEVCRRTKAPARYLASRLWLSATRALSQRESASRPHRKSSWRLATLLAFPYCCVGGLNVARKACGVE